MSCNRDTTNLRRSVVPLAFLVALVFLTGCAARQAGGPRDYPAGVDSQTAVSEWEAEWKTHWGEYERLMAEEPAMGDARDAQICAHVTAICRLADRICALAVRYPQHSGAAESCQRSKTRCQRARSRTSARCAAVRTGP